MTAPTAERRESAVDHRCGACRHPFDDHDAIGLRFCRATLDSALTRGCVCRPA